MESHSPLAPPQTCTSAGTFTKEKGFRFKDDPKDKQNRTLTNVDNSCWSNMKYSSALCSNIALLSCSSWSQGLCNHVANSFEERHGSSGAPKALWQVWCGQTRGGFFFFFFLRTLGDLWVILLAYCILKIACLIWGNCMVRVYIFHFDKAEVISFKTAVFLYIRHESGDFYWTQRNTDFPDVPNKLT